MSWSTRKIDVPAVTKPAQAPAELLALVRVEAGGGLVEADEQRSHDERPRDADELALPLGQLLGHRVRQAPRARAAPARSDISESPVRRDGHGLLERAPDGRAMRGDEQVLADRQVVEQLDRLPRPREPEARTCVRRQPRQVATVELDASPGAHEAGDRVDEGRLARAVRPDEADELPRGDLEIDVDDGVHAAEAD